MNGMLISSGFKKIDECTGGIKKVDRWLVNARPGSDYARYLVNKARAAGIRNGECSNGLDLNYELNEHTWLDVDFVVVNGITDFELTEEFFSLKKSVVVVTYTKKQTTFSVLMKLANVVLQQTDQNWIVLAKNKCGPHGVSCKISERAP